MSCKSLKFNGVDLATFTDTQLKQLCLKHQIITTSESHSMSKEQLLIEIKQFLTHKMNKYKGRRLSQPNIVNQVKTIGGPPKSSEQLLTISTISTFPNSQLPSSIVAPGS